MLATLMIITFLFFFYITRIRTGTYNNPITYYLTFWLMWILISLLDPFDLWTVSDRAYLLIWINILCFAIGFILICKKKTFNLYENIKFNRRKPKALVILQIILLIVIAYYYVKYNSLLENLTINDARRIRFELGFMFNSYYEYVTYSYFISSFLYLTIIRNIVRLVVKHKFGISGVITLISIVLYAFTGLGRFIIFDTMIFFFIAIAFKRQVVSIEFNGIVLKNKIEKSIKIKYLFLGCIGLWGMMVITGRRMGKVVSGISEFIEVLRYSIEQGVVYFIGPFRALDNFLNSGIHDSIGYTFGRSTFSGLDEIFCNFAILAGSNFTSANAKMALFTAEPIYIGAEQQFNAFYTGVMNFYLDGRIVGVIILAFLYGVVSAVIWNYYNKNPDVFSYSLLIYFTYTTIASEYRLSFISPSTWVILFILVLSNHRFRLRTDRKKLMCLERIRN